MDDFAAGRETIHLPALLTVGQSFRLYGDLSLSSHTGYVSLAVIQL